MVAPLSHPKPITGGAILSVTPDGEQEWKTIKRMALRGSFDNALHIRTAQHTPEQCTHVEVSGNPVKWFQNHNLWGTDDLHGLVYDTLDRIASLLGIVGAPREQARTEWRAGSIRLTRVDVTESFHLDNRHDVLAWLRAAEATATLSHRGRGQLVKGTTLYFGKNSRRWSLKLYSKGQEIDAKGHGQGAITELPWARAWADRTLRAELTLRGLELDRLGLRHVRDWTGEDGTPNQARHLLAERLGGLTMTTHRTLSQDLLDSMRPALRSALAAWEGGSDLRTILPRRTFYKFRSELLPHGIDVSVPQPREASNVVPLVRILEARPAPVPQWAVGTPLYFEPRYVA